MYPPPQKISLPKKFSYCISSPVTHNRCNIVPLCAPVKIYTPPPQMKIPSYASALVLASVNGFYLDCCRAEALLLQSFSGKNANSVRGFLAAHLPGIDDIRCCGICCRLFLVSFSCFETAVWHCVNSFGRVSERV